MRHDILEIASVPRKQSELKALIGVARQNRRKSNLTRFAAANLVAWALIVLVLHGCAGTPRVAVSQYDLFLPVVITMQGE